MQDEDAAHLRSGRVAKVGNDVVADYQVLDIGNADRAIAKQRGATFKRRNDVLQGTGDDIAGNGKVLDANDLEVLGEIEEANRANAAKTHVANAVARDL